MGCRAVSNPKQETGQRSSPDGSVLVRDKATIIGNIEDLVRAPLEAIYRLCKSIQVCGTSYFCLNQPQPFGHIHL